MRRYRRDTRHVGMGNDIRFGWMVYVGLRRYARTEGRRLTEPRSSRDTGETDRPAIGKAAKMPATTIHFVRHGKVENPGHLLYERLPGFHLSELGVRMAQATAHYIAVSPQLNTVSAVYSSPLERTRETAGEILESLNSVRGLRDERPLELKTDERLIEAHNEFRGKRIGFGEGALWKNGNWKLVRNLWKPSWGESYQSIARRMQDFALEKVDEYSGKQIVVVSHESPIWSYRHMLETGHPEHNMLLRHTALASITSITYDCDTKEVLSITYVDPVAGVE